MQANKPMIVRCAVLMCMIPPVSCLSVCFAITEKRNAATRIPIVPKHKLGSYGPIAMAAGMILSVAFAACWGVLGRLWLRPSNHVHAGARRVVIRCYDIT